MGFGQPMGHGESASKSFGYVKARRINKGKNDVKKEDQHVHTG